MNSRKLVNMSLKTVFYGGLIGLVTSFIVSWETVSKYLSPFDSFELLGLFLIYLGIALTSAVMSLAGFLAYVFIHRFGQSMLRSFWPTVQIVLIAFILFDIVYFSNNELSLWVRISIMLFVLFSAIVVALIKMKQTNKGAIIPALFFMVVITTLELTLSLRTNAIDYIIPMAITLVVANGYQITAWYHVTKYDPEHVRQVNERRRLRERERQKAIKAEGKKSKQNKQK